MNEPNQQSATAPPPRKEPHWDDEERRYYTNYLCTQRVLMFVGIVGILIGVTTLFVICGTLKATEKSAEATLANVRPWLTVADYDIPHLNDIPSGTFRIKVKNVGKAPSTGITVKSWLDYKEKDQKPPEMGACPKPGGIPYGAMEAESPAYFYPSPMKEQKNFRADRLDAVRDRRARLFLHGCLDYGLQGNAVGDTEFCAELYVLPDPKPTIPCGEARAEIMK
jgi:hypothetical protein